MIDCPQHGSRPEAFVCRHLLTGSGLGFHWGEDPEDPSARSPDAWCNACEGARSRGGGWNDRSEAAAQIRLVCDQCYAAIRARNWLEDAERYSALRDAAVSELFSIGASAGNGIGAVDS